MERRTVSLRINPEIWKEARKFAIDNDVSMAELIENALKNEIKKRK